ncbi:G-type lectin S-receptor-like serine/threonine-protein kinase At5g35370 [Lolium rigidum]|uniref:G-type lectin S-receptor-like serine/threonine-protein kinase At5g35370 n=1 Tax=Lolium rigidum TaxID=89674 RepID=UPI001F5D8EED|nr:G-type lectin S-receptor-like serine/threonine-protein kinase At5g35370 [Lolium rigidum]
MICETYFISSLQPTGHPALWRWTIARCCVAYSLRCSSSSFPRHSLRHERQVGRSIRGRRLLTQMLLQLLAPPTVLNLLPQSAPCSERPPTAPTSRVSSSSSALSSITIVFGIVLPTVAAVFITFLLYVLAVQWLKNRRSPDGGKKKNRKHGGDGNGHGSSWFMLKMMSSRSSSRASSNAPSEMGDDDNEHHHDDGDEVLIPGLPARFTFADLETATSGFRSQIGSGGFGSVYRGELPDRTTVAVKRMNNLGTQGRREFLTEIAVIGNVHHVNLVKLRGFCADHSRQLMLVYEFMSRGSLDQSLFLSRSGNKKTQVLLEWPERVGVCVGAARGLAYLHAGCDRKILHCDVKPENILLDERGGVKIADFGLAKLLSPEQSGLFTTMRGTRGYLAPEWLTNAPVSDKADVYSFGMVLLEIVRGAKNSKLLLQQHDHDDTAGSSSAVSSSASSEGHGGSYFPAVALEAHEEGGRRYAELVDARLEGRASAAEVARVVRVALCCLHEDASLRPAMTAVAAMLDGSMEVCEPRTEQLAYLRMYGRGIVGGGSKWKGSDITTGAASSSWSPPSCVSAQQLSAPR